MIELLRPLALLVALAQASPAADAPAPAPEDAAKPGESTLALPGQEPARPFVPRQPRTAEDQARVDALRGFATARALEVQGRARDAIGLLEQALEKDPDSIAILRRLSRLCFGLGRIKPAIDYSKRVIQIDPNDTATLAHLSEYYRRRGDAAGGEALLTGVLANPKLDKGSATLLLAQVALGDLYAQQPGKATRAADAYARVVEGLDARAAARFSPADLKRILGDEAESYEKFGDAFLKTKRYDLAITAYRRALIYKPDGAEFSQKIALAQLRAGKPTEALATVEALLKEKPPGVEPYDLLAQVLTALKRQAEILPRLEEAARADPKNAPLQYALADRLREAGQVAKADTLYKALLASQPDPQGFAARSESLRKQKKDVELLKLFEQALAPDKRPAGPAAIMPQLESIALDPPYADELIAAGIKLLEEEPPGLGPNGRIALILLADKAKKPDKVVAVERLAVKQDPSPTTYRQLAQALNAAGKADEAATTLEQMLEKFPDQKSTATLLVLGQLRLRGGQYDAALESARDALKLDADNIDALNLVGILLGRLNRNDEAVAHYKGILERFPNIDEIEHVARAGLSAIYVNMDEYDKGEAELEALLAKEPDDDGINNDLGYLYADRGKHLDKAEAMIRKAVEEKPENGAYLDSLGWVLFKRGKVREAVVPLEKATRSNVLDATIYDHLGDVYFRLQEPAKAKAAWEKAAELAAKSTPPDKRLPEIRKKLESLGKLAPAPKPASGEDP